MSGSERSNRPREVADAVEQSPGDGGNALERRNSTGELAEEGREEDDESDWETNASPIPIPDPILPLAAAQLPPLEPVNAPTMTNTTRPATTPLVASRILARALGKSSPLLSADRMRDERQRLKQANEDKAREKEEKERNLKEQREAW